MKGIFSFDGFPLNPCSNNDADWGPYDSLPNTKNAIKTSLRAVGKHFGMKVYDDQTVVSI